MTKDKSNIFYLLRIGDAIVFKPLDASNPNDLFYGNVVSLKLGTTGKLFVQATSIGLNKRYECKEIFPPA